ncbi:type II CRISPR RNA-guided endonuclease Cas9 [Enterococcus ratti]|uniref:type II CRISPR RNA-guided endonuclease Cas9 n=1 Tax=Enterococcus ratti TaxID=150033 RepID=UPI0008FFF74C|nr:type II CRISPR RNA-guided endonuclease Cas9 [Enterococcus ratti]
MTKEYTIGLDIGTNSVGWAIVTDDYRLMSKKMSVHGMTERKKIKKNFWGARLFDEGQTAQVRRNKRTSRRRLTRRRFRITELQKIFAEELLKKDANFFARLDESFLVPEDKNYARSPIFPTLEEKSYYQSYPTIYHLRQKLADSTEKADIRLIYLALAHIIKYRGHFLFEGELNTENTSIEETFKEFLAIYNQQFEQAVDFHEPVLTILTDKLSKTKKVEKILTYYPAEKMNGCLAQFLKLIVGNQGNFKQVFALEEEAKIQFSKETYEEELENIVEKSLDEVADVFLQAKKVYDAILLSDILSTKKKNTKAKLSLGMIERYEDHKKDLEEFKRFVKAKCPDTYAVFFKDISKNGYAGYIDGKTTQADFYKFVKKKLNGVPESERFLEKIEQENFLLKQRTFANGVIPHQIHLTELKAIIERQKHYYPFLEQEREKIISLLTFRIPYYVGPLAQTEKTSSFAWLERKTAEKIKPWNASKVIDYSASAIKFIQRMINCDTYLPSEKVLPKHSLLYQKYMIFNELTKVVYKDERGIKHKFSSEEKKTIFKELFQKHSKVTVKKLQNFLFANYNLEDVEILGIDKAFNASYATYHDFLNIAKPQEEKMKKLLEDPEMAEMFEEIVKILTIFEDREMIKTQLKKYQDIFEPAVFKKLMKKHYTGWGRLSQRLINGIKDRKTQKTILDYLIDDDDFPQHRNRNFMQLINDENLSFKSEIAKELTLTNGQSMKEIVEAIPGSPAIKKGIWQTLKIVEELITIMGDKPKNIVIEMARENQTTAKGISRSHPRLKSLEEALKNFDSQLLKEHPVDNQALQKDRLYLYYLQNGKDMYTEKPLDIHRLSEYDIDHIIPRNFIVDNSIDNKVLVASKENRIKKDDVPGEAVVQRMRAYWEKLLKAKLISEKKFSYLTKLKLTPEDKARFIQRQIVETRQITKQVAAILNQRFNTQEEIEKNEGTRIITLKSALVSQFRKTFGIYKVREINHHHHAHDAYLNGVVAIALLKKYPKLAPEFVYGRYPKFNSAKENKATAKKELYSNILRFFEKEKYWHDDNGEIFWDKARHLPQIKKVIHSHQVNIVKKVEVQTGAFYKETVNSKEKPDKLIKRKNNWDVTKYGGFGSPVAAYAVAFIYEKGKNRKKTKAIEGIMMMDQASFEKDPISFLREKGYPNVIRWIKLPKYTLFELESGRRRMLASHQELQKANSFILPERLVTLLYHAKHYDEVSHKESYNYVNEHRHEFNELLNQVIHFSDKYTLATKNTDKIKELYDKNQAGDVQKMAQSFVNLMQLNAIGAPADFKFFDASIPRKRYNSVTEIWEATIIYQSITGLYETRRRMADLWAGVQ